MRVNRHRLGDAVPTEVRHDLAVVGERAVQAAIAAVAREVEVVMATVVAAHDDRTIPSVDRDRVREIVMPEVRHDLAVVGERAVELAGLGGLGEGRGEESGREHGERRTERVHCHPPRPGDHQCLR